MTDAAPTDTTPLNPFPGGYPPDLLPIEELSAPPGSARLSIRRTDSGEAGVFSIRRIPAGRLVESCLVLAISEEETAALLTTSFADRLVEWPASAGLPAGCGLLTGCGAVYRHSAGPNAFFVPDYAEGVVRLFSMQEILPGHEIRVDRLHGALRRPRSSF